MTTDQESMLHGVELVELVLDEAISVAASTPITADMDEEALSVILSLLVIIKRISDGTGRAAVQAALDQMKAHINAPR